MSEQPGMIILVGAGPGDPGLLTLAGRDELRRADVVVYDRLVNPALLSHAAGARHVCVGKKPGESHAAQQARINELILAEARAGGRVVRLKGGDSFVFGRGGEEATAARAAGIELRVVPGVTSALGAAAEAGIPLTHRRVASSVVFVTGSTAEGGDGEPDWRALAGAVDTIVIYMCAGRLASIAAELIAGGRGGAEPALVASDATLPGGLSRRFTLGELASGAAEGLVRPPAVAIIGPVVDL